MRKTLWFILIAGFLVKVFLWVYFLEHRPEFFIDDDSVGYLQLAENMRLGKGFSWQAGEPFEPNSFRTPGYPAFLAVARTAFGHYEAALIFQILLVTVTAGFIFLVAKEWGRPKLGLGAAGIFLFMPFSVMVSLRYLTQPLFTFGLMGAVWLWLKFLKTDNNRYLWFTALLLPLLALIRPIAFYIYLPFLAGYLWYYWRSRGNINWLRFVWVVILVLAIFFFVLSPWLIRNWFLFGHFALSSITAYQLYFYDTPAVYAYNHGMSHGAARQFLEKDIPNHLTVRTFDDYMTFEASPVLFRRAQYYLTESWLGLAVTRLTLFLKFFIRDGLHYWAEFGLGGWFLKLGVWAERAVLFLLGSGLALSTWRSLKYRDFASVMGGFFLIPIAYFALLTGAMASAGLRFPIEPLFILGGLAGLKMGFKSLMDFWKMRFQ